MQKYAKEFGDFVDFESWQGGSSKNLYGDMLKADFRISTISIPRKVGAFWAKFSKMHQFCKLGALDVERKPTHRYTKNDEKAP